MKRLCDSLCWVVLATAALSLSGCLVETLMTTAVTADMAAQNAGEVHGAMNDAQVDTDLVRLQEAVELYAAEKEAMPTDLNALVPAYIDSVPLRPDGKPYGYNPVTGEVFESGAGPSSADYVTMEKINMAINAFGTQTGYYPPKLDDLYPTYLPLPPRTTSGKQFNYNNQNGEVTHPDPAPVQADTEVALDGGATPQGQVKPVNAVGSLQKGDLKDSNSLNSALDRMGY